MKKNIEDKPIHTHMEMSQGNSLCSYLKQAKMCFLFLSFFFYKIREQVLPRDGGVVVGTSGRRR
jgi:hypothetical protein